MEAAQTTEQTANAVCETRPSANGYLLEVNGHTHRPRTTVGRHTMAAPYYIATIAETITEESAAHGDVASSELSDDSPATLREALDVLQQGCWDSIDWRHNELIAYPADWHQDFRTGDHDAETLVIRARRPEWLDRLYNCYTRKGA